MAKVLAVGRGTSPSPGRISEGKAATGALNTRLPVKSKYEVQVAGCPRQDGPWSL